MTRCGFYSMLGCHVFIAARRCRLYRVTDGEWKQRGTGDVKILKHKETGAYRLVMRQEKTLKLIANHRIDPVYTLVADLF